MPKTDANPLVVLITGAAHRIGASTAELLHGSGMNVIIHYRGSEQQAIALTASLNAKRPDSAHCVQGDLLAKDTPPKLIEAAVKRWGRLDVLINNASTFYPTPVGSITEAHWDDLLGTNLKAPLFLAQAAAPHLKLQYGSIVNIVDIHAERPLKNFPVYSIAKAGLVALTKSLARELGPEIRVNGVAPGAILWPEQGLDTAQKEEIIAKTALKRSGDPIDIARAVQFFIRDADYTTGQIIAADGGRSLSH